MKNKTFISFCINLLVGVLFSFPVFSAQSNVHNINLNKGEFNLIDEESGGFSISDINGNSYNYPDSRNNIISQYKFLEKNQTNNKDKTEFKYSPPGFKELFIINSAINNCRVNPNFVNLSFLKDLRTIKMRC